MPNVPPRPDSGERSIRDELAPIVAEAEAAGERMRARAVTPPQDLIDEGREILDTALLTARLAYGLVDAAKALEQRSQASRPIVYDGAEDDAAGEAWSTTVGIEALYQVVNHIGARLADLTGMAAEGDALPLAQLLAEHGGAPAGEVAGLDRSGGSVAERLAAIEDRLHAMTAEVRTRRVVVEDPKDGAERVVLEVDGRTDHSVITATDGNHQGAKFEVRAGAGTEDSVTGEVDVLVSLGGNVATMFAADIYGGRTRTYAYGPDLSANAIYQLDYDPRGERRRTMPEEGA